MGIREGETWKQLGGEKRGKIIGDDWRDKLS